MRNENGFELEDINGNNRTIWLSRDANIFGNFKVGDLVAIGTLDSYNTIKLIDVRAGNEATGIWVD